MVSYQSSHGDRITESEFGEWMEVGEVGNKKIDTYPAPAMYRESFPMEIGMPITPKSPNPRIREPNTAVSLIGCSTRQSIEQRTIGDDGNASFIYTGPIPEDLTNFTLVLDRDILDKGT